jgi:MoaA/NifB/PqqE/SkfB family radical SAM enzyme
MSLRADVRLARKLAVAALDRDRPIIANLIVTRRCNLSCGNCPEYDKVSPPVPTDTLIERNENQRRLDTVIVTLTGGESLLHPHLAELVRYIDARGMVPMVNTNGYLLTRAWIENLNAAGLYGMQLSIDNVNPNEVSKKSLRLLLPKLKLLAAHAKFRVRINTVLGSSPPAEAVEVARTALGLGFDTSCSFVRHGDGSMVGMTADEAAAYDEIRAMGKRAALDDDFQARLARDGELDWKCRAGARTFHVTEDGMVNLCAPQQAAMKKPIADYTVADIRRAFDAPKPCAKTCPIAYAHHASKLDRFRAQDGAPIDLAPAIDTKFDPRRGLPVLRSA